MPGKLKAVAKKTLVVHYVAVYEKGPLRSGRRVWNNEMRQAVISSGLPHAVACQPTRKYLSRLNQRGNKIVENFIATPVIELVTCEACKNSSLYKRDIDPSTAVVGDGGREGPA